MILESMFSMILQSLLSERMKIEKVKKLVTNLCDKRQSKKLG